jgi:hypothetical protein
MHKGFKCLDVEGGRVYISRDIVFDEIVFPFTKLNPNAGVHLRFEILLPFDSKPYNPPSHRSKSSVCPTAGVPVNPVSTNGLSLSDSAEKKFRSIWCRNHPGISSTRSSNRMWRWHTIPGGFGLSRCF